MADIDLSSDSDQEFDPPVVRHTHHKGRKQAKSKASSKASKTSQQLIVGRSKSELRRHEALERQFNKASKGLPQQAGQETEPDPPSPSGDTASLHELEPAFSEARRPSGVSNLVLSKGISVSMPDVSLVPQIDLPVRARRPPEATYTPSAAGLRPEELSTSVNLQSMLSEALAKILAAGLQQGVNTAQPSTSGLPSQTRPARLATEAVRAHTVCSSSEDSDRADEGPEDLEFSEDEGLPPEKPAFTGLFRPSVFKSLLHKAKITTQFGLITNPSEGAKATPAPHDALFRLSKPENEAIPCPPLFADVVQSAFTQPGSLTAPSGLDKRLYCAASELEDILALPSVDAPVASLASTSLVSTDVLDGLKSDERKTELGYRKAHQAAAWTIKAATATSFFNRASLIWLRQLQERLPTSDTRIHQDINKIVAATEYSADASLTAAKFAARTMASCITNRRLFWLRHWKADARAKWKLASSAYKAPALFGAPLEPLLVEDKEKRKVLPSSYRRPERRFVPYNQRQSFRTTSGPSGSYTPRQSGHNGDRGVDRQSFRDRSRNQAGFKRPFRGGGYRSAKRGK